MLGPEFKPCLRPVGVRPAYPNPSPNPRCACAHTTRGKHGLPSCDQYRACPPGPSSDRHGTLNAEAVRRCCLDPCHLSPGKMIPKNPAYDRTSTALASYIVCISCSRNGAVTNYQGMIQEPGCSPLKATPSAHKAACIGHALGIYLLLAAANYRQFNRPACDHNPDREGPGLLGDPDASAIYVC